MPEITIILDDLQGDLAVEDNTSLNAKALSELTKRHGASQEIGCARPLTVLEPPVVSEAERAACVCVRIAGYYHDSLTEGPGRRSSVLFQFCPLRCKGCWVTHLHTENAGSLVPVARLAELLLNPKHQRDGVSILGGEPFAQPDGLLALIGELRQRNCPHIVCYSGYTLETLHEKAAKQSAISRILDEIDVLIDGAYQESLAASAGAWTGSGNQRVIDMNMTRATGKIVLYGEA